MKASTSSSSASPSAATTHEWVVRCVSCARRSSRIQNSPCIAVPGASKRPQISNRVPATSTRVPSPAPPPRRASAPGDAAISSAPRAGQRPSTSRTCGCTMNACGSMPRNTAGGASRRGVSAGSAARSTRAGSATWISGETAGMPATTASPSTLAARTSAVAAGSSLRSTLSSLPEPISSALVSRPVAASERSRPRANATEPSTSSETSVLPPVTSTSRFGDRPRLRMA